MTIKLKSTKQYFPVVLYIILCMFGNSKLRSLVSLLQYQLFLFLSVLVVSAI